MTGARTCARCGTPLDGRSPRAKFCSDRCRNRHHYQQTRRAAAYRRALARLRFAHADEFDRLYAEERASG